ncbi:MAG: hypothetical protein K6E64_03730 [Lachnospiraceae bacterium]|nr:hypothetical protein [Lachnospiraceae bacterium]
MRHIIWNNNICELMDYIEDEPSEYKVELEEGMTPSEIAYEEIERNFGDEQMNLSGIKPKGTLILIGAIQRWNGGFSVYKELKAKSVGEALPEMLGSFDGDNSFEIFVEDGDVTLTQTGHDNPTNPARLILRAVRDDLADEDVDDVLYGKSTKEQLEATISLGKEVGAVYGWEVA